MISRCKIKTKLFCVIFFCCDDFRLRWWPLSRVCLDKPSRAFFFFFFFFFSLMVFETTPIPKKCKSKKKAVGCTPFSSTPSPKNKKNCSLLLRAGCCSSKKKKTNNKKLFVLLFAPSFPFFCDFFLPKKRKTKNKRDKSAKYFERTMRGFSGRTWTKKSGEFF